MARENLSELMARIIKAISSLMRCMGMVFIQQRVLNIQVNGPKIKCVEKGN
jgi:hypothetical protein